MARPKKPPYAAPPTATVGTDIYAQQTIAFEKYECWKRCLVLQDFTVYTETYTRERKIRGGEGGMTEDTGYTYTARVKYITGKQGTEKIPGIMAATRATAMTVGRAAMDANDDVVSIVSDKANKPRGNGFKKGSDPRRKQEGGQEGAPEESGGTPDEPDAPETDDQGGGDSEGQDQSDGDSEGQGGGGTPPDPTLRDLAKNLQTAMDNAAKGEGGSSRIPDDPDLILLRKNASPMEGMEALIALSEIAVGSLEPAVEILQKAVEAAASQGGVDPEAIKKAVSDVVAGARLDMDQTKMADGRTLRQAIEDLTITKSVDELVEEVSKRLQPADTVVQVAEVQPVQELDEDGNVLEKQKVKVKDTFKLGRPVHPQAPEVVDLLLEDMPVALVGPTGCGKTVLARDASEIWAKAVGGDAEEAFKRFGSASVTGGMSEGVLIGRLAPTGKGGAFEYMIAQFADNYEKGGPFLLDEGDAADPNVMLVINQAMSNGHLPLPYRVDNPEAERHEYFRIMTAWNTWGTGANRMFVGRNQLDGATLDRFLVGQIEMDYSQELEKALVPDLSYLQKMWALRDAMNDAKLRRNLSTRFIVQSHKMVAGRGWDMAKVMSRLTGGWSADEKSVVQGVA